MKKNCFALILLLCCCYSYGQSTDKPAAPEVVVPQNPDLKVPSIESVPTKIAQTTQVFARNPLPQDQKAAPAIFYVKDDQPCDRPTYMRHLKQTAPKN